MISVRNAIGLFCVVLFTTGCQPGNDEELGSAVSQVETLSQLKTVRLNFVGFAKSESGAT